MEAGGSAEPPIAPAPWRFFGDFLGIQKVTRRRGGETPPAEKRGEENQITTVFVGERAEKKPSARRPTRIVNDTEKE